MTRNRVNGTTTQRGYGTPHQKLRNQWKPLVDTGQVQCHATTCHEPTRWITPGTPWHLGHTTDRQTWTGPEHQHCSTADGARRGNRSRTRTIATWITSRRW